MYIGSSLILYILRARIYFLYDCTDRFLVCIPYVKEKIVRISMLKTICLDNWWLFGCLMVDNDVVKVESSKRYGNA